MILRSTPDVYFGLENPTDEEWNAWHAAMLEERRRTLERAHFDGSVYRDPATAWSDRSFRQFFLFMYDASFYDRAKQRYRTRELIEQWRTTFGRVDSVLLWHAYPRLGFDTRTQFDFYRDMPGGLAKLRAEVADVFHAEGIRVLVDYNPWDKGSYEELAAIVDALGADGVMLDTMTDAPDRLRDAMTRSVVLAPELRPKDEDLRWVRQSWAQWSELGEGPSIYRHRWLVPRHRQFAIRRWDRSRRLDIVYSFWCGSGLILWDNIFGSRNPYTREDRKLIAETAALLDRYEDVLADGGWHPLIPTGVAGLDANRWTKGSRTLITLRNRTASPLRYRAPFDGVAFWGDRHEIAKGQAIAIAPHGVQTLVDEPVEDARASLEHFRTLSKRADVPEEDEASEPRLVSVLVAMPPARSRSTAAPMIDVPGGDFEMTIRHDRRECGCYALGASPDAIWGWFYKDTITHRIPATIAPFAIRVRPVTKAEFVAFVQDASYRPVDPEHFLASVGSLADDDPIAFVSLDDARAYAAWHGERLPTEAEWQCAAETCSGLEGMSGGAWELTESEHTDGHTRFVMLRGGSSLPPGESEWLVARGVRPPNSHTKYILLGDGLDRSSTISFRTVVTRTEGSMPQAE